MDTRLPHPYDTLANEVRSTGCQVGLAIVARLREFIPEAFISGTNLFAGMAGLNMLASTLRLSTFERAVICDDAVARQLVAPEDSIPDQQRKILNRLARGKVRDEQVGAETFTLVLHADVHPPDFITRILARHLQRQVNRNDVVLDIGTGTGLLALVASRMTSRGRIRWRCGVLWALAWTRTRRTTARYRAPGG